MKTFYVALIIFFGLVHSKSISCQDTSWAPLLALTFNEGYDARTGEEVLRPKFSYIQHELNRKEITLKGFIIPLDGEIEQHKFIFSAFPIQTCFFCGKAGPESIVEVTMAENRTVEYTTAAITIKGTLYLNLSDPFGNAYLLHDAFLVKD